LSNAEKEALWLTGHGDALPRVVEQALEQALARGTYIPGEEALRLRLADALDLGERLAAAVLMEREAEEVAATEEATTEGQEAAKEPPADEWRSPLEIVTEGPEEAEGESALAGDEPVADGVWVATDGEDAAPSAVHPEVEDQDFSTFSKLELVNYAFDMFGVKLKQSESKDRLIAHVQGLVDEANGTEV
jgi:hypothetical protein